MSSPSILVGIVTRDRMRILPRSVASALAQRATNVQVAVIDNGSSDATPQLADHFPPVQWSRWDTNCGYLSARNHLMNCAVQDYFVSLDDDAWFLLGDEIAVAVNHLEHNASVAAVAFDILSPDRPLAVERTGAKAVAMFIGCGHVLRLAAAREVGFYESMPGSYGGEEKDLCLRLMDVDYRIVRLPGVHVWHDKTAVARVIPEQHRSGVCNDLAFTLRRTPLSLLPAALAAKFYRHWRFAWRHELTRPCLQGFSLFLRSMPTVLRSRKPVRVETLRSFIHASHG